MSEATERLAAFQRAFSQMLRTPLDRSRGSLAAVPASYPAPVREGVRGDGFAADERLAVYNRQYWFRLFTVLQDAHPLTTALVGAWAFNGLAATYLQDHPPTGHELATICDGFAPAVVAQAVPIPRDVFAEALANDVAFHRARTAPNTPPVELSSSDEALHARRLVRAPTFSIFEESRPLLATRRGLPSPLGEHRAAIPAAYTDGRRAWLVGRTGTSLVVRPLASAQAALYAELDRSPLGMALAEIEARDGEAIAPDIQRWLAQGIQVGLWRKT